MSGCFCRECGSPRKTGVMAAALSCCYRRGSTRFFVLMFSAAIASSASAETIVWEGSATDDWFSVLNWAFYNQFPGPNDTAEISSDGPTIIAGKEAKADQLMIGNYANGTMTVEGSLSTAYIKLGTMAGFSGTLNFSGGSLSNERDVSVGEYGTGELRLSASSATSQGIVYVGEKSTGQGNLVLTASSFETRGLIVAGGAGSSGSVSVAGQNSKLVISNDTFVGDGGVGALVIAGSGAVKSQRTLIIGNLPSSDGSALRIGGAGSLLETEGELVVGNQGAAHMVVETAAVVVSDTVTIGRRSVGEVNVTGDDTKWTTGDLLIGSASDPGGAAGYGMVGIKTGGKVKSASARLGIVAGATGAVTVDGGDSVWEVGSAGLEVGVGGTGSLGVSGGGVVDSATTVLAVNPGSSGTVTVAGSGSILRNTSMSAALARLRSISRRTGPSSAIADMLRSLPALPLPWSSPATGRTGRWPRLWLSASRARPMERFRSSPAATFRRERLRWAILPALPA
jgi:T5SS/PEP-CTERM-associated repeat protein